MLGEGLAGTIGAMQWNEALRELEALGDEAVRRRNAKNGAGHEQYGVKLGDIRKVAKRAKADQGLATSLWSTGNVDARLLAILVMRPKELSADDLDAMVREATYPQHADWLNAYVVKKHPAKEALRERWMQDDDPAAQRAGWSLTAERVAQDPAGLDVPALLDRIEAELADAHALSQWTMNTTLVEIGVHLPEHRERAIAVGERLGVYRDFPTSKGCTSPFAPEWIAERVRQQG